MSEERPSWDSVWSDFAKIISQRSCDPRFKVGAVIVTEDNTQVLSVGYNGDHKGGPNSVASEEAGQSGFIHAEVNALVKMDFHHPKKKKMYLTLSPCLACAKLILNAGIDEVHYIEEYRDIAGINLLKELGVYVQKGEV